MPSTVLIIDDDRPLAAALQERLEAAGFDTTHADGGVAGLERASETQPDLIILDIRMPDLDGFEVCSALRGHTDLRTTPVVFLSSDAAAVDVERARTAGGDYFMPKPYRGAALVALARSLTVPAGGHSAELAPEIIRLAPRPIKAHAMGQEDPS